MKTLLMSALLLLSMNYVNAQVVYGRDSINLPVNCSDNLAVDTTLVKNTSSFKQIIKWHLKKVKYPAGSHFDGLCDPFECRNPDTLSAQFEILANTSSTYKFDCKVPNGESILFELLTFNISDSAGTVKKIKWTATNKCASSVFNTSEDVVYFSNNNFYIQNIEQYSKLSIYTTSGMNVYETSDLKNINPIGLLSEGVYVALLEGKSGNIIKKIVVE